MLNEEYSWSLIQWLLSGMFTTIFSGAGFVFITVAVEYAKEYNRKRIAKERKVRRLFHRNLERSPVHSVVCTQLSKRRNAKLTRKNSMFEAYKRSHVFLGNAHRRPKRDRPVFSQQDTPICNSDYGGEFSDDQEISGNSDMTFSLNSERMTNFTSTEITSPILISRHHYNVIKGYSYDHQGSVTCGDIERHRNCVVHPLDVAGWNTKCSDFARKISSLKDSDDKSFTYCQECHRNLTECAFIRAAVPPTAAIVNEVNNTPTDTNTKGTSMERSFDPISWKVSTNKDGLIGDDDGDSCERTKTQTRHVRRWNSCIKPDQVRRLFKGDSLNEMDKRNKGKAVLGSIADITAIDDPERKMAEFGGTHTIKRSQSYLERYGTTKNIKWVSHNVKTNDVNSHEGPKDHFFAKGGIENKVRQKLRTSAVPDIKNDKQIPGEKAVIKSIMKSVTLSETNVTRNISLKNNTKLCDKPISKANQSEVSKMQNTPKKSNLNDIDLQKQNISQERGKPDQPKIPGTVFKERDEVLNSHGIDTSNEFTRSETGNGDHPNGRKQSITLELENAQRQISHAPRDECTIVKKSPNYLEQKSVAVEVGQEQEITTRSNRPQSVSRVAGKTSTGKYIAIKHKRKILSIGLNEENRPKQTYQRFHPADDSQKNTQSNKKTNMIEQPKRHPPNEKMVDTRKSMNANQVRDGKATVKTEKQFSNVHETSKGRFTLFHSTKSKTNTYNRPSSTQPTKIITTSESKKELKDDVVTSTKITEGDRSKTYAQHKSRWAGRTKSKKVFNPPHSKKESKKDAVTRGKVNEEKPCQNVILRKSRLDAVVQEMERRKSTRQKETADRLKVTEVTNNLNPSAVVCNQDGDPLSDREIFKVASGVSPLSITNETHETNRTPSAYYAPMYGFQNFLRMVGFGQERSEYG